MIQADTDSKLKIGKENKDHQEQKKKTPKNEWWKPMASDIAVSAFKSVLAGFFFKFGSEFYESSFNRRTNNSSLSILNGGKKSMSA